ncbi:MAG: ornithine acetyltransferase [Spirochaetae bacterium HGW-Spirochaetae-8]|jgi:glutamate N-acetyltransferase/amino-acid N-acetyltransferase|nr:MAG: ornithine acetyltransferase [Spirochaetae bacterium HGW-Spirochaetae-8]
MQKIAGGITAPKGFSACGVYAGIKKKQKLDLALVVSDQPAAAAGAFTTNIVKAAPVIWDQKIIAAGKPVRAIVVNSGNANACTGEHGLLDTQRMAQLVAQASACAEAEVLVCSTGVIGVPLPMGKVEDAIALAAKKLSTSTEGAADAAAAICTTDTFSKEVAVEFHLEGKPVRIGGIAKGSGMIHPNMATMLSFITTDACISATLLQDLLGKTVVDSYNMISVDGDTSTNDTVLALANGCSDTPEILPGSAAEKAFTEAFLFVHTTLARLIVQDGEGAGKFIEVTIQGAATEEDARLMARSVISSSLVKTAFFGADANWGRILCAMGYSGAKFNPDAVSIRYQSQGGSILVVDKGVPVPFDEALAKRILEAKEVQVLAVLSDGDKQATAWGCDLSYEYVRINGDYRS